jgi:hypothetical protein
VSVSISARERKRRRRQRFEHHQAACARARKTLLVSGWALRPDASGNRLVAERPNGNGSLDRSSPLRRLYGHDELELLKKTLKHLEEPPWLQGGERRQGR